MNGDEPPHKPAEQHGPDLPAIALDLPPGLSREQIDRVQRAARDCREALRDGKTNYPIENQLPAERLEAICKAYEAGQGAWEERDLDQILQANDALTSVIDEIRDRHDSTAHEDDPMPSAYDSAQHLVGKINAVFVEVQKAIRAIDRDTVQKYEMIVADRHDVAVPGTDAEHERREISEQVTEVEVHVGEVEASQQAVQQHIAGNQYNVQIIGDINISLGDLNFTIQKLKASIASIKISFEMKEIFSGMVQIGNARLTEAIDAIRNAAESIRGAAGSVEEMLSTLDTILKPLARVAENGDKLVQTVRQAWTRLFGAKQELPWPTGLRLLPPEGSADESTDFELVEIRRFEAGDRPVLGLAPLPGGRFVSGGDDSKLRLWSLDQSEPLATLEGHEGRIWRIAALDETHVVTASEDHALILWDLEHQKRVRRFEEHEEGVEDVTALGPDRFVSVAGGDLRIWHPDRDDSLNTVSFSNARGATALDPDRIVTGEYDKNDLCVLKVDDGSKIWSSDADGADIWKTAAIDDQRFMTIDDAENLFLWSLDSQQPICALTEAEGDCQDVAALSTTRAVSAHDDGIYLWSLPDGALLANMKTEAGLLCIRALPREPGGPSRFVRGGKDGYLALWEVRPKS